MRYVIALIWFLNGFYAKLINGVPRHALIVARILGPEHAFLFTRLIGVSEIAMSVWVLSRIQSRICCWVQVLLILTMNTLEFVKARDLLLFGGGNFLLALLLVCAILWTAYFTGIKRAHV